jgi:coenzyme F420-reducing hydrogenase beta subunit
LQSFNKRYSEKVKYTLGLICDRTLCKTATDVLYGNHFKRALKRLVWRDKSLNYKNARILIKTADNRTAQVPTWKRHALKDSFTNPRCRICFDKLNTGADIVFGDPWGMSNVDWKGGESLVITRTKCGDNIISEMMHCLQANLRKAPLAEVITGQHVEKRKKDVSSALAYYQINKQLVPSYAAYLSPTEDNLQLNALINKFVVDSSRTKEDIIKSNTIYLRNTAIKTTIHRILRLPIRIIRRIIR